MMALSHDVSPFVGSQTLQICLRSLTVVLGMILTAVRPTKYFSVLGRFLFKVLRPGYLPEGYVYLVSVQP